RLANAAKTISIADVSLGMSPEEALAALKAVNPNFKINVLRLDANWDCTAMITQNCMADPKKHWLTGLDAQTPPREASEQFQVQFTSPPSKPFIYNMYRHVEFSKQTMPTVQNVMAGLRKKYGPESVHPIDSGEFLIWIIDEQGHALEGQEAKRVHDNPNCHAQPGAAGPDLAWNTMAAPSPYRPVVGSAQCLPFTIVEARISPAQMRSPLAAQLAISVTDYPLYNNGTNSTYAWLNQLRTQIASKQVDDAKKRGGAIKY